MFTRLPQKKAKEEPSASTSPHPAVNPAEKIKAITNNQPGLPDRLQNRLHTNDNHLYLQDPGSFSASAFPKQRPKLPEATLGVLQRVIDEAAFVAEAATTNPKGKLGLFSSLNPLRRAIRAYEQAASLANLQQIIAAKAALPDDKKGRYGPALQNLEGDIGYHWYSAPVNLLLADIQAMPESTRRGYLEDATIRARVRARPDGAATALMGALLLGDMTYWKPNDAGSGKTDFGEAVVNNSLNGLLPSGATANCWEFVMYAAQLTGSLSPETLVDYFNSVGWGARATYDTLGWHEQLPGVSDTDQPNPGDLVFIRYLPTKQGKRTVPFHVTLAIGGYQVLSHDGGQGEAAVVKDVRFWTQAVYEFRPPVWRQ